MKPSSTGPRPESVHPGISSDLMTPLAPILADRIRSHGPISFAEFMRGCLYHPEYGYYSRSGTQRFNDYYTSVDVHPIFGRLLARQLAQMWTLLGAPRPFVAVEAGAGFGPLAAHILDFAATELPEFYSALEYIAVDRSFARREQHAGRLAAHIATGHAASADTIPQKIAAGCIFSNELPDAFPTHRVVSDNDRLREIFVDVQGGNFVEVAGPPSTPLLEAYFAEQGVSLADGIHAEVCLEACDWIETVGQSLERGFVVTIDYGHEAQALYNDRHNRGTLLAYRDHVASENILATPGLQDLTSHVNFTALDIWGRRCGLQRTGLVTQSQFLVALGRDNEFADLYDPEQNEVEKLRARLLLKNLIHPEGLGEKFQVLIQHKGVETPHVVGLSGY